MLEELRSNRPENQSLHQPSAHHSDPVRLVAVEGCVSKREDEGENVVKGSALQRHEKRFHRRPSARHHDRIRSVIKKGKHKKEKLMNKSKGTHSNNNLPEFQPGVIIGCLIIAAESGQLLQVDIALSLDQSPAFHTYSFIFNAFHVISPRIFLFLLVVAIFFSESGCSLSFCLSPSSSLVPCSSPCG